MSDKVYKPIACQLYDQLEILSMRGEECTIQYLNQGESKTASGKIVDLFPISSVEYLKLDSGKTLRLDMLVKINDIDFSCDSACSH